MKLIAIIITSIVFLACSSEPGAGDHPPQAESGFFNWGPRDYSGLVSSGIVTGSAGGDSSTAEDETETESVATSQQALTSCTAQPNFMHAVTNVVIVRTTPIGPSCPAAWYHSTDPFSWRVNQWNSSNPVVPSGTCQFTRATTWRSGNCTVIQQFACPNGVTYTAETSAANSDPSGDPWWFANVHAWAVEPGCTREMRATFNGTGI